MNDDIEKVADEKQPDNSGDISFKKLVKIFNLCHLFVPIIQLKPNNSTHLSLDISDLRELTTSKEKYKRFVDLQTESLELMVEGFQLPDTVSSLLYLVSRHIIEQNQYS